jgi:hypothetical protein
MLDRTTGFVHKTVLFSAAALLLAPLATLAQSSAPKTNSAPAASSDTHDRWLHVRVVNTDDKNETVRVNIPLDLAEKILPTINKERLHNGKVRIDEAQIHGDVDLHALMDAIRTSKDGEFVTVQGSENDVRVAKEGGRLIVHVTDKSGHGLHHHHAKHSDADKSDDDKEEAKNEKHDVSTVEIMIPMKVIDALFSAGKDELDLVAALHALSAQGDVELVSVKSDENTVRVWLDSKNVSN